MSNLNGQIVQKANGHICTKKVDIFGREQCFDSTFLKARDKAMSQDLLKFSFSFDFLCYLRKE